MVQRTRLLMVPRPVLSELVALASEAEDRTPAEQEALERAIKVIIDDDAERLIEVVGISEEVS